MRADELFTVIGDIDEEVIETAITPKKSRIGKNVAKWGTLAACIAVVTVLSVRTFEQGKRIQKEPVVEDTEITVKEEQMPTIPKIQTDTEEQEISLQEFETENTIGDKYDSTDTDDSTKNTTVIEESPSETVDEAVEQESNAGNKTTGEETANDETINEEADKDEAPSSGGGGGGSSISGGGGAYREKTVPEISNADISGIFGGTYFDENGNYVIVITEDTSENREILLQALGKNSGEVVFKKGDFPLSYLMQLHSKILKAVSDGEIPFVITSSLVEKENRIEVCVATDDETELNKIRQFDEKGEAIIFTKSF